jgi:hypothetical protein
MTIEELNLSIARCYDEKTAFARLYLAFNELLDIARIAENAELLDIFQTANLVKYTTISEGLCENYDKLYNVMEV